MSDDQHASNPGATGSATSQVSTKARIHLTPAQYYTRLTVAFMVGAIGGIIAGFLVARLFDEPPIKVRGGGVGIEIISSDPDVEWEATGNHWRLKAPGINLWGEYDVNLNVGSYCSASGPVPKKVKSTLLVIEGNTYEVTTHGINTVVKPMGGFSVSANNNKLLEHGGEGGLTLKLVSPNGDSWECRLDPNQLQELCLFTNGC